MVIRREIDFQDSGDEADDNLGLDHSLDIESESEEKHEAVGEPNEEIADAEAPSEYLESDSEELGYSSDESSEEQQSLGLGSDEEISGMLDLTLEPSPEPVKAEVVRTSYVSTDLYVRSDKPQRPPALATQQIESKSPVSGVFAKPGFVSTPIRPFSLSTTPLKSKQPESYATSKTPQIGRSVLTGQNTASPFTSVTKTSVATGTPSKCIFYRSIC